MTKPTGTTKARPSNRQAAASRELGFVDTMFVGPLGGVADELFPERSGLELRRDLWKMSVRDETFGSMMWCINATLAQVAWGHVACVDGVEVLDDPQAIEAAAFADSWLIDMDHTMQDHIEEAISMIIYGFAPCEIVLKQRDGVDSRFSDKMWGIKKLPLRDQMGVINWIYEGNDAVAYTQMSYRGSATIPLWKSLNYRTTSRLDRPEGRPMMLNALRAWKLKEKIQDSEAIGIERDLCGLPVFSVPEEVLETAKLVDAQGSPTPEALVAMNKVQSAIKAVRDMRFNQTGGLIVPSDTYFEETSDGAGAGDRTKKWDFKLVTTAGSRTIDTRTAIRDYDRAIARMMMMQFLHLGDRSSGSYALSDDQSSLAVRSLMALAMKIAGEWNKKLMPLLWAVNAKDPKYMPRMRASEISKDGIAQMGQLLQGLGRAVGLWESDIDMRMAIAKLLNLPANREAQQKAAELAATPPPEPQMLGHNGGPPLNDNPKPKPKPMPKAAGLEGDDDENS